MAQAIITKYLPATNTRGSRIKVSGWLGSKTYPWDHALDGKENHEAAMGAWVEYWSTEDETNYQTVGKMGSMPCGTGYAVIVI